MTTPARSGRWMVLATVGLGAAVACALVAWFWTSLTLLLNPSRVGAYSIPSENMAPTLVPGDYIVAERLNVAAATRGTPIVFHIQDGRRVGRIVGLPGDRVELRAGTVYLNGKVVAQRLLGPGPAGRDNIPSTMSVERLPGEDGAHRILDLGDMPDRDNFGPIVVPPKTLFLLGDNRDNAGDSRFPRTPGGPSGMVAFDEVDGRVAAIYWSKDSKRVGKPIDLPAADAAR